LQGSERSERPQQKVDERASPTPVYVMSLLKDKLLWGSLLGLFVSGSLLLFGVGYLGLVVVAGLLSGAPLVDLLLDVAAPAFLGTALLVTLLVASGVGVIRALARRVSMPTCPRLASVLGRIERAYPPLGTLGLSDRFAPPRPSPEERTEQALADLKRRYVDGEITEAEFERELDRLVADDPRSDVQVARGRNRSLDEAPNGR